MDVNMNQGTVRTGATTRRRKADPKLLSLLRAAMLVLGGMVVVLGLLLIILPTFRVKEIVVEGNKIYNADEIIKSSGIEVGEELLALDVDAAINNILTACPYIDSISINNASINSIRITIREKSNVMYTSFNGKYVVFDRDFHVLSQTQNVEELARFIKADLPPVAALAVGGNMYFANTETNMDYVGTLLDKLEEKGILDQVTAIDFSKKFQVSYVMNNNCLVELGRVGDLDTKLMLVDEILAIKGRDSEYAVVDVSSTEKPTYRLGSASDFLMN